MPTITIINLHNRELFFSSNDKSALKIIHENQIDWMHACGGKGRCTSCKMIVVEGMENLPPLNAAEQKYRDQGRLAEKERLACQCLVKADLKIKVAQKNKFPHINYSD